MQLWYSHFTKLRENITDFIITMVVLILTMEQHEIKIISCPGVVLEFPQLTWTRQGHNTILPVFLYHCYFRHM